MNKSKLRQYANETNKQLKQKQIEDENNWRTNCMKLANEIIEKVPSYVESAAKGGSFTCCVHIINYYGSYEKGYGITEPRKKWFSEDYSPDWLYPWDRKIYDYCVSLKLKTRLHRYPGEGSACDSYGILVSW